MDVHRAARVAGAAHGGQVVLTEATYRIAVDRRIDAVSYLDLGLHRLKDLPAPEHLFQLGMAGLPSAFPPLRSLGSASNLPTPPTSLVGRDREVADLAGRLTSGTGRLTTLVGTGGTGKTRLALAGAAAVRDHFPDGVYFVPLADATTADVMWTTIAESLGVVLEGTGSPAVLEHLGTRRVLLVLDNLEQLKDAAAVVVELLDRAPGVQVLATSRRPLRVAGEHEVVVEPLPVASAVAGPDAGRPDGGAAPGGAVELFVERVRLVRPDFAVTPENADDVRELGRRLDGLPLAIELVAARARLLGPRAMLARLDGVLALSRVTVDGPERQHTLRHALDWSYQLLRPEVRTAFGRLGACDGDFGLAAAGAVVDPDRGPSSGGDPWGEEADDELDVVAELVDASLLTVREGPDGEPRLAMLGTVALYARELLVVDPDADRVRAAHAEHYLRVAEEASRQLRQAQHLAGRSRLERELPNLRAALAWSLGEAAGDGSDARLTLGLRLCEQLSWFWYGCGYATEGRRWLEAAVRASSETALPEAVAALHALGVLVMQQGDGTRARELLETCLAYRRKSGDPSQLADELNSLGLACRASGDPDRALALAEEAVAVARQGGHQRPEANAVTTLAILAIDADRGDEAVELLRRCLELDTSLGDVWGQAADHLNLASALLRARRVEEAHAHLLEHAPDAVRLGDWELSVDVLDVFCAVHARRGDAGRAARLLGATVRMRQEHELPLAAPDARWFESVLAPVRDLPDADTWRSNMARGARWDVEEALGDAMAPPAVDGSSPAAR